MLSAVYAQSEGHGKLSPARDDTPTSMSIEDWHVLTGSHQRLGSLPLLKLEA